MRRVRFHRIIAVCLQFGRDGTRRKAHVSAYRKSQLLLLPVCVRALLENKYHDKHRHNINTCE